METLFGEKKNCNGLDKHILQACWFRVGLREYVCAA